MKTINVNGTRFALPSTMPAKDVQALVGFLATLQTVESHYNYDQSDYLFGLGRYPEVRLEDIELTDNAKGKSDLSYESYKARRDAEKATTA